MVISNSQINRRNILKLRTYKDDKVFETIDSPIESCSKIEQIKASSNQRLYLAKT